MYGYFRQYPNNAIALGMSAETYPELFETAFPDLVGKSPKGWTVKPENPNTKHLWLKPNTLNLLQVKRVQSWIKRFETYVLIGRNDTVNQHFDQELDFCMALDYTFTSSGSDAPRTDVGEAINLLKYHGDDDRLPVLTEKLAVAIQDLGLRPGGFINSVVTHVPSNSDARSVTRDLAASVATESRMKFMQSDLTCQKLPLKGAVVDAKVPTWTELYVDDCVELRGDIAGKVVVVIDDLYQSGATMWMFARFLKEQGAKAVVGIPCVKTFRDTDNT